MCFQNFYFLGFVNFLRISYSNGTIPRCIILKYFIYFSFPFVHILWHILTKTT